MFFYLLFVPSALLSIVMIAYLRGLKKHDTILYSLCQCRRDIIQFLWENRETLTREEYLAVRKLLVTMNHVINRYNSHKTIIFNLRKLVERARKIESFSRQPMSLPDNEEIKCLYFCSFLAYCQGFLAYTPLIRSELAVRVVARLLDAVLRVKLGKISSRIGHMVQAGRRNTAIIIDVHRNMREAEMAECRIAVEPRHT